MMLLSDGSVLVQNGRNQTGPNTSMFRLSPQGNTGSYVHGVWSGTASMQEARFYFPTAMLPDGRVFAVGGEYGPGGFVSDSNTAEIYDPVANTWNFVDSVPTPDAKFGDDPIEVISNGPNKGQILAGYLNGTTTYRFNPAATAGHQWTQTAGSKLHSDQSDEEAWVKLKDGSILSYDIYASGGGTFQAQRFGPFSDKWVDASTLSTVNPPHILEDNGRQGRELGPAFLQPDGNVIYFGANGRTAIYNPTTNIWTAGPAEPTKVIGGVTTNLVASDDPGAVLPNGHILIALSPQGTLDSNGNYTFPTPSFIYDYDPVAHTFTDVSPGGTLGGTAISDNAYRLNMVVLPTGQVLMSDEGSGFQVFTEDPATGPQGAWRPTITSVVDNGNGTFTLNGNQLNGIDEGSNYGDDNESASNYPIIQLRDVSGNVLYARTFNWSTTGVATGSTPESVQFTLPPGTSLGDFPRVNVIANGIPAFTPLALVVNSTGSNSIGILSPKGNPNAVEVIENNVVLYNGPWYDLASITVNASDGDDVNVENTVPGVPVTVNAASFGAPAVVEVSAGLQDLGNILGPLTLNSTLGANKVIFHDNNDQAFAANYTLGGSPGNPTLQRDSKGLISYSGFNKVEIDAERLSGSTTTDHFNILMTPQFCTTTINGSALGSDQYLVRATVGGLIINTGLGSNSVAFGSTSSTSSTIDTILGSVVVNGSSVNDTVIVNDQGNPLDLNRTYTLTANTLTRSASPDQAAPITFNQVVNRVLNLSSGTITVQATPGGTATQISGATSVNVGSASNTLDAIQGAITLSNLSGGTQTLNINDQGGTPDAARSVKISATTVTWGLPNLPPQSVNIVGSPLQTEAFNVRGTTTVEGTASGTSTVINVFGAVGFGSPAVILGQVDSNGNGTLQTIGGPVTIQTPVPSSNPSLQADVTLNDFKDTKVHNVFITPTAITNLAPFQILLSATSVAVLDIAGSISTGSMYTIEGAPASEVLQLAAFGPDTINVQATTGGTTTTILAGSGGGHTFNVGSNAINPPVSTLDAILGLVNIVSGSAPATDTLNILDQGSTTPHTYTLTQAPPTDTFTRSAPGAPTVTIEFSSTIHLNPPQKGALLGNPPAAAELAFPSTVEAGRFATMSGRLVGTGALSLSVDWGDGNPAEQSTPDLKPFRMKHKYTQPGTYHVRAVWTDSSGQSGFRELTITVEPAKDRGDGGRPGPGDRDGEGASRLDTVFRLLGNGGGTEEVPEGGAGRDLFFASLGDALFRRKKNEALVGLGDDR
jgi:hypothetical protein